MKVSGYVFAGFGGFFAAVTTLYWFTSYEDAGTTLLAISVLFAVLIGAFLLMVAIRRPATPEDRADAMIEESVEDLGSFPASSVWPLVIAVGAVTTCIGLVLNGWLAVPGLVLLGGAVAGMTRESRLGA